MGASSAAGSPWVKVKGFAISFLILQSQFHCDGERRLVGLRAPGEVNEAPGDAVKTPRYALKIPVGFYLKLQATAPLWCSGPVTSSSKLLGT